jgi:ATP-binding cassette subfamily C protein CydC
MFEAVMALPTAYQYLGKTKSALNRLTELEKSKPFVTFSKTDPMPILKNYDIEFKNIRFSYSYRNDGLTKFNLSIKENQKIAIMGKTGAGKSTLLHLIARSFDVTDGEILIGDINIKNFSEDFLRKTVTFIEQKPHLFNQSIRDNLKLANEAKTDAELLEALKTVSLKNHIESLEDGLDTIISEFGANFSGGQIRRLSLARALLSDAPIILLDEPTEGLDRKMEIEVIQAINKISQNKTVILVTHSVYAANEMDQIVHLSTT